MSDPFSLDDARYMAATLRYARRHRGLTATNPSVGTMLVSPQGVVVGRGITAKGGRPHAETLALRQAGERAKGTTAYVSLEPCAHHGATPPCAQALIDAQVARVVTAWTDPDNRVDGKGHAMLQQAGIRVETGLLGDQASADLSGYLNRKQNNRPHVVLKLAVSADGMLGRQGEEVAITGLLARAYGHRMRAEADGILVGRGTVVADDPDLTCRLPGLQTRSPHRFVLDSDAKLSPSSMLAKSARQVPVSLISANTTLDKKLEATGVQLFVAEHHEGMLALPEILEDIAGAGFSSLMVEGGAQTAQSFLEAGLVDEIALFTGVNRIGGDGIRSPLVRESIPTEYSLVRSLQLGDDRLDLFRKKN